jgi:hypothetical protein
LHAHARGQTDTRQSSHAIAGEAQGRQRWDLGHCAYSDVGAAEVQQPSHGRQIHAVRLPCHYHMKRVSTRAVEWMQRAARFERFESFIVPDCPRDQSRGCRSGWTTPFGPRECTAPDIEKTSVRLDVNGRKRSAQQQWQKRHRTSVSIARLSLMPRSTTRASSTDLSEGLEEQRRLEQFSRASRERTGRARRTATPWARNRQRTPGNPAKAHAEVSQAARRSEKTCLGRPIGIRRNDVASDCRNSSIHPDTQQ